MKRLVFITLMAIGLLQGARAHAGNLLWSPASAAWDTSALNWWDTNISAQVAFTNGNDVIFDDSGFAFPTVGVTGTLTPGAVVVDASIGYTFTAVSSGKLGNVSLLTKRGSGKLILDTDNTITAPTVIEAGTLEIGGGAARGALGSGNITNNSLLSFNRTGTQTYSNLMTGAGSLLVQTNSTGTVNIKGSNSLTGAIIHNSGGILNFSNPPTMGVPSSITIAPIIAAANTRFQISGGIALPGGCPVYFTNVNGSARGALQSLDGSNSVSGPIYVGVSTAAGSLVQLMAMNSGSEFRVNSSVDDLDTAARYTNSFYLRGTSSNAWGKLYGTINLPQASLVKNDNSSWTLYSSGNVLKGTLIAQGALRLGANNALPDAPLTIGQASAVATFDLAGYNQQVSVLSDVASVTNIIANSSTTSDSILTISGPGGAYSGSLQDSISNGTRRVGITILSGAQQLKSICSYSGPTTIMGGGVSLVGSGSIPNSTPITINSGAAIDASSRSDGTLTLGAAQTLRGTNTFNINGNLTIAGTVELKVNKTGGIVNNDTVAVAGTVNYGGTLHLVLSGEDLVPGDVIPVFSAAGYGPGSFTSIVPAAPAPGYLWDTSQLSISGLLQIVGPLTGTAVISAPGTNVTYSGTGGIPGGGFTIVGSTDISAPLGTWSTVQTGTFDGSGNFSVVIPILPGAPQKFYDLRVP